jgi:hypothetical protein
MEEDEEAVATLQTSGCIFQPESSSGLGCDRASIFSPTIDDGKNMVKAQGIQ